MVEEERRRAMEDFEPLPAYLHGETERKMVTSRPASTLFISNLPSSINEAGVANVFREFGDILNLFIIRNWRRPTNFCKVSFATRQEAANAIKEVDKQPPLFLNVAFERAREARDFQNDKEKARLKFGEECSSMFQKVEIEKEKISEKLIQAIAKGDGTVAMDSAPNKAMEDIYKVDCHNDAPIRLVKQNLIEKNISNFEGGSGNEKQSKEAEADIYKLAFKDLRVGTTNVEDKEPKAPSISSTNSECSAVFGQPLFVPYMVPSPCVQCNEPGRMLCSRCHVWYCSLDCQATNWPTHKEKCLPIQEEGGIVLLGEANRSSGTRLGKKHSLKVSQGKKSCLREKSTEKLEKDDSSEKRRDKSSATGNEDSNLGNVNIKLDDEEYKKTMSKIANESAVSKANDDDLSRSTKKLSIGEVKTEKLNRFPNAPPAVIVQESNIPVNEWTEIIQPVSSIESPAKFWIQPQFQQNLLKKLGDDLEKFTVTASDILLPEEEAFCLVECNACWARGQVIHLDHNTQFARVRLIDFGGEVKMKYNSLFHLPLFLAATPAMAVLVGMDGIGPPDGKDWTQENREAFKYYLCEDLAETDATRMWIKPVRYSDGIIFVAMRDHEANDLAELYVELGLAKRLNSRKELDDNMDKAEVKQAVNINASHSISSQSSREESEDLLLKQCNPSPPIIERLSVGNVYEFARVPGHPLSEFGATCHFDMKTYGYIYNQMQIEYLKPSSQGDQYFGPNHPPSLGDKVVVFSVLKSTYYRALVLNLPTQNHVEVLLVDVGDTEVVPMKDLFTMVGQAANEPEFPFLAVRFFSLNSLSSQAERAMTGDPTGKIRVVVENVSAGSAAVGVLNEANIVVARYRVESWQYLHPQVGQRFPTEISSNIANTVSRHKAVFVSQTKPVNIADGDTVFLRDFGKFACSGIVTPVTKPDTDSVLRVLKQTLAVCETLPRIDFPPQVGQILAVQKSEGRKMMRAEVVKVDVGKRRAMVRCLDFPDNLLLSWSNMTLIPHNCLSIPTQCLEMRLAGVPKIPRKQALSLLQPILTRLDQPLRLSYQHQDLSSPVIYLFEASGKSINDLIISCLKSIGGFSASNRESREEVVEASSRGKKEEILQVHSQMKQKESSVVSSKTKPVMSNLEYQPDNYLSLPIGKHEEIFVLHVEDSTHFCVCSQDAVDQLEILQEKLQEMSELLLHAVPSVSNVYLVHSQDGNWYRAVILKTRDQKCLAYFPDFGFKEIIHLQNVRGFHGEFYEYVSTVPFFASSCIIRKGVQVGENSNFVENIHVNDQFTIQIVKQAGGTYLIDM